jgi:acetylornithine deacetylase/succinyl-diaminopimelate desuccinylase-like protein
VGGAGGQEIATLIEAWARDGELETERLEEAPGRPSVVVRARHGSRTLMLCGHIDTVNAEA